MFISLHEISFLVELLSFYKFPGDENPIIRGSALSALQGTNEEIGKKAILKLMDVVDEYIPDPLHQLDKPFLIPVEDVFSIQTSNTIKQKRKEKAGKWEVPLPKVRPVAEDEMFKVIRSDKRKTKQWKRMFTKATFVGA